MKQRFATFIFTVHLATAGQFTYGPFGSKEMKVTIQVLKAPEIYLGAKNVRVLFGSAGKDVNEGERAQVGERVRLAVEQQFATDFDIASEPPDCRIVMRITEYTPPQVNIFNVSEKHRFKIGERVVEAKTLSNNGTTEEVYQDRVVLVQYWQGTGTLKLDVEVYNAGGTLIDSFSPAATSSEKITVAIAGESQLAGRILPTREDVLESLVAQAAKVFGSRYLKVRRDETFQLAVEDELRPGNVRAIAGDWPEALRLWEAARIKKKQNEGDRLFNMGVANEVLAYKAYSAGKLEESDPLFKLSIALYSDAERADPKDHHMVEGKLRVTAARNGIDQSLKQYTEQREKLRLADADRARQEVEAKAQAETVAKAVAFVREDTSDEANFRKLIAIELRRSAATLSAEDHTRLEQMGVPYHLLPLEIKRVIGQEIIKRDEHRSNLEKYRSLFGTLAEDNKITKEEREQLASASRNLNLAPDEVKTIEAQYRFTEDWAKPKTVPAKVRPHKLAPTTEKSVSKDGKP